jgi:nitrilase
VDRLAEIATDTSQYLVIGVIEREIGTLFCTVLFFSPEGYLGKHRKLVPTAAERVVWGCGDGSTLPVFDSRLGRLGAVICWENYMPLLRTAMYAKECSSGVFRPPTAVRASSPPCAMSHEKVGVSCFRVTSSPASATIPRTSQTISLPDLVRPSA